MTRFEDEGGDVGAEPVLLQRLLPAVVASEEGRWPGVTFELAMPGGLPTVIADPTYVEQVVRNLLSNAAKYGGAGTDGPRRGRGRRRRGRSSGSSTTGPGFPPDEADQLFELFFRSAETPRTAAGAGIGLFVCARLIRAMGGRIWARNRPEGGAEFGFALRVMDEDADDRRVASDPAPPAGDGRGSPPTSTTIAADDDEEVRRLVEERQLEVHAHDAGQDDRRQGDRRHERQRPSSRRSSAATPGRGRGRTSRRAARGRSRRRRSPARAAG